MSHENQHKNLPSDQAKEGDQKQPITSAKTANENITAEPQAPSYEAKFHSFSSSRDSTATTGDDQPLLDLIKRVTGAGASTGNQGRAVSEFAIEDAAQGVVHTHRGAERLGAQAEQAATAEPAPRQSFLDGLKKIFDHASSPEEREQMQSAFSIDYMMRKAKEFIGDVQSLITGKPVAVEKLPYDPSTGADVQPLPFRPGEKDSQPVEMIIRERTSPNEPEAARSLGVQITEAVLKATGADAYNPSTGTLPIDAGGDIAEDKSTPRPPRQEEEDARHREEMIIRQQMSPGESESLTLGGQFAQAAIDATGADAYNPNTGTWPIDSAGRPSTAEDRSTVRPHPPRPGEEDTRREEMIIRQQMSPGESEALGLGGQLAQAAISALPLRPGIDDDKIETLPYKPGDNDQPVQQIIREVTNDIKIGVERIGEAISQAASSDLTNLPLNSLEGVAKTGEKHDQSAGPKVAPGVGLFDTLTPEYVQSVFDKQSRDSYAGEPSLANTTIPAGSYKAGTGWSFETVAEHHLGNGFSKEQVQAYAREIAHINGVTSKSPEHVPLVLPGHDGKGGMTLRGSGVVGENTLLTKHLNGSRTIERAWTHRSAVIHSDKVGGTIEEHTGRGQSDKFLVHRSSDGKTVYQKDATAKPYELNHSPEVSKEHNNLHNLAEKLIPDTLDRAKFEADMARFEDRARSRGLSDHEVAETYKQVARLMDGYVKDGPSDGNCPAPGERLRLAEEVLSQAAEPRTISQGQFMTCQITCIEAMIYEREPSKAAALVADVAMTGQYVSPDGTVVRLDKESMVAQDPAYFLDNHRSFATQLFNVTAVNLVYRSSGMNEIYSQDNYKKVHHGLENNQYVIQQIDRLKDKDTGERLYTKNLLGQTELSKLSPPGLDNDQIVGSYLLITGRHAEAFKALSNPFELSNYSADRTPLGVEIAFDENIAGKGKLVDAIHTESDLRTRLETLAKTPNGFPIMIRIHTQNEPFYSDSGEGIKGGAGGWHAVRITGFVPPNGVKIDNQWDAGVDHESSPIPLHQLYLATKPPEKSVVDYEGDVNANRSSGHIDTAMEFQLLRLKHAVGQLNDYDYGAAVAKQYLQAKQRWQDQQKNHTFDQKEKDGAEKLLHDMQKAWQKASPRAAYGFSGVPLP